MVFDKIENSSLYYNLGKRFEEAFLMLKNGKYSLEPGTYEVDGKNLYYMVQDYTTKKMSEGKYELHKRYADLQYVVSGEENMGYAHISGLSPINEYDTSSDKQYLNGEGFLLKAPAGYFAIFFPEDGHMPCMEVNSPSQVKKIVFKILL